MTRNSARTVALAVCLVVAAAAAPVVGLVAPAGHPDSSADPWTIRGGERVTTATPTPTPDGATGSNGTTTGAGGTGSEVMAGEAFASAVAAQDADLEGAVQQRVLDRRLASAGDDAARARALGETVRSVRVRLALLDDRRASLRAAVRDGTISQGRYRVAMARLTTEARSLRQLLARADAAAERLPRETRAEYGLANATFDELRARADLVGDRSGTGLDAVLVEPDSPGDTATIDRPDWNETLVDGFGENETDDTLNGSDHYDEFDDTTVDRAEEHYPERRTTLLTLEANATELDGVHDRLADRSDGDREVEEALACARDALGDARADIEDARAALDAGEPGRADERIADARGALTRARDCLEEARAALQDDDDGSGESTPTSTQWKSTDK